MKICAHTLVKNEERYLWFAVTSIIDHVDKVLIWDTGSTDNTVLIIKELIKKYPKKVSFKEVGNVDINEFTKVRQEMLEETKADWVFILDGDEVWWDDSIRKVVETINKDGNELETIVNRYCNIVGDIYHYQDEAAGRYEIDGRRGHLTIRAMNCNIPGLKYLKPHGQQGVFDENGNLIQERDKGKRYFIERSSYLHFTHMIRSSNLSEDLKVAKRKIKIKQELGNSFPKDFYYPEAFFKPHPVIVASPWSVRSMKYKFKASALTPLRYLKRKLIKGKSGY